MQKIMFNDKYGLTDAVLQGTKTMSRREPIFETVSKPNCGFYTEGAYKGRLAFCDGARVVHTSHYRMNEIVAVAQCYEKVHDYYFDFEDDDAPLLEIMPYYGTKGWKNKMFVKSDLMPHHIRITDIKVERLQDISDEDCLQEGITTHEMLTSLMQEIVGYSFTNSFVKGIWKAYNTPREAFTALIDKVSGKGTWEKNPWVFAYSFERIS